MQILSHRGCWEIPEEKNALIAFDRSFAFGFGLETYVRDCDGVLVISHNPPRQNALPLAAFLDLYQTYSKYGAALPLALNIKADGLQNKLKTQLAEAGVNNYFVFDMSVPDAVQYVAAGMPIFTRQSEYEMQPALYCEAIGVWVDAFEGEWLTRQHLDAHLEAEKKVCLVSPELHRRPHDAFWGTLYTWNLPDTVLLCTDYPEAARKHFYGTD